jgi:putative Holliday junction resolvase
MRDPVIATKGRVLGVDLGEVRTGLALTDLGQVIASAHETLDGGPVDEAVWAELIDEAAQSAEVVGIVVGLPRNLQGRDGPAAQRARRIALDLGERGWTVDLVDERFTTTEAERVMIQAGARRASRKKSIDRVAAALILQTWLDGRRMRGA